MLAGMKTGTKRYGLCALLTLLLPIALRAAGDGREPQQYALKGEFLFGATASYGTIGLEDADLFALFDDIGLSGNMAAVHPFVGYFYKDNRCVGIRVGYTHIGGGLDHVGLNIGMDGLDLTVPQIGLASDRYSVGLFHRSYLPIDGKGRFGVFGETEASLSSGNSVFGYSAGDEKKRNRSKSLTVGLGFSPGMAVYIFPNVCLTLSFGLGGFKYNAVRQFDEDGNKSGERQFSKLNFKLDIADIRFGMNLHLWSGRKKAR